ncbi:uracil-DNA glycosylase [Treponema sp.]|uniref:uracil-DNA glycosylase n=1 Tax=Treponema sp. TaxID=166 RepID=UPI00298D871D|nr:uracil-DNA glycosylase family protein [Treponema sp.]MCR5612276.1 uracil-DNA glycosylase [Treponema sp.]
MKAVEKEQLFNLLKTTAAYINGYMPQSFSGPTPAFTDDIEQNNAGASVAAQSKSEPSSLSAPTATSDAPSQNTDVASAVTSSEARSLKPDSTSTPPSAESQTAPTTPATESSIESIAQKIASCNRCVLCTTRTHVVPGTGVTQPLVLVIGEGPGHDEDIQGLPFVGAAGQLLDKMLAAISLSRKQNCYIANIVKCRPPQNRDPSPEEISACISFLEAQIHILKPKMILMMGRVAAQTLLKTSAGIHSLRGSFSTIFGIPAMATYHPSALLRDAGLKAPAWQDLKAFRAKLLELAPDYERSYSKE